MGSGELQLTRPLAVLHGSLIQRVKGKAEVDEERMERAEMAVKEILKRENSDAVRRQVNLFLLLNTELDWTEKLLENDAFSALAGVVEPRLTSRLYYRLVDINGLWAQVLETLAHMNSSDTAMLGEGMVQFLTSSTSTTNHLLRMTILTSLAVLCVDKGQESRRCLNASLKHLSRLVLEDKGEQEKAVYMSVLLLTLRTFLEPRQEGQKTEGQGSQGLYAFTPCPGEGTLDWRASQEVQSLLKIIKSFLENFSFNDWISMLEFPSSTILQYSSYTCFWPGPHPPSNMQLLLSHLAAQCKNLLSHPGSNLEKEVVEMLGPLAKIYDRRVELGMEDKELGDLLKSLKEGESWVQVAVMEHLVSVRMEELFSDPANLTLLPPPLLEPHLEQVVTHLLRNGRQVIDEEKHLVREVLQCMGEERLKLVLEKELQEHGLHSRLSCSDLTTQFVFSINKANLQSRETKEELLRLAVLDGRKVATLLVGEVCKHKGQTDTVAGLIKLLNPVFQWKVKEEEVLATLVRERMEGKEEQERENVGGLCLAVLREESHYSQGLVSATLPILLSHHQQGEETQAAFLAVFLSQVVSLSLSSLDDQTCLQLGLSFVSILNSLSFSLRDDEPCISLRQASLGALRCLFSRQEVQNTLMGTLSPENQSYFSCSPSSPSLLQLLHSSSQGSLSGLPLAVSPLHLRSSLLLCLPRLLPSEWDILIPFLAQAEDIDGVKFALRLVTDCVIELLFHLPHPPTEVDSTRHSLVLSYSQQLTAMAHRGEVNVVAEELCLMLEWQGEERYLLWAALHGVLSGGIQAMDTDTGDKVLAWLAGRARTEERDIALKIIQQQEERVSEES